MEKEKEGIGYYPGLYQSATSNIGIATDFYNAIDPTEATLNPRQIFWIKKRKARREILDSLIKASNGNYIHESRHRHAMKRLRAPSGRFLTKEEMNQLKQQENK